MSFIKTLSHAFAVVASDAVKAAKVIETTVVPALRKANADQAIIEAVTNEVSPQAAGIERTAFAVLGEVLATHDAAITAGQSGGLNLALDASLIADLKAVSASLKPQAVASLSK